MTNLDTILKIRDITLPTKVCLVKAMVFPVVMYGFESWTIRKGERRRIDTFELWCWRRLLRVPWTARRSNQSILKKSVLNIHWKDWFEAETPILWPPDAKSWHLKTLWCWERLRAGGEGDDGGCDGWMSSPTQWAWVWVSSRTGMPGIPDVMDREAWHAAVPGVAKSRTWLSEWTELNWCIFIHLNYIIPPFFKW